MALREGDRRRGGSGRAPICMLQNMEDFLGWFAAWLPDTEDRLLGGLGSAEEQGYARFLNRY